MSLSSMTGHGHGQATGRGIRFAVELSSVNRKQLDIQIGLPRSLSALESRIHAEIQGHVSRGRVSGEISASGSSGESRRRLVVDRALARHTLAELRDTARSLKLEDDFTGRTLLQIPQLLQFKEEADDLEEVWPVLQRALKGALKKLIAMRRREGEALKKDLAGRLDTLGGLAATIAKEAPLVAERYRAALHQRLEKAGLQAALEDERVARELIVFADRSDITEEITRLGSHLQQARKLIASREPAGRTLDFLSQELLREINTVGSKANDAQVVANVVTFKSELERFREQVQNIE